jgi:hypothetical protein
MQCYIWTLEQLGFYPIKWRLFHEEKFTLNLRKRPVIEMQLGKTIKQQCKLS